MGAPSWSGTLTTPAIAEQPLAAVALVDAYRAVVRATALFLDCCGSLDAFLTALEGEIETVLSGDADQTTAKLDRTTLDVSAFTDSAGARYALLTIARPAQDPAPDGVTPLLGQAIDASPAIAWLKGLDGRYLRVNGSYVEQLGVAAESVCGKTEDDLAPGESIEGRRWRAGGKGAREPLEFEYTVDAADGRPAFAVLRFAVRGPDGKPASVCGVAASLVRADVARTECARLMRLERWSRSDELAVRAELIAEWGLTAGDEAREPTVASTYDEPPLVEGDGDHFAAMAAELDAALETSTRLDRELAEERRQVMVLREASALAARRAHELLRTVTAERARTAELEEAVGRAETRAGELERERDAERSRAERAEAAAAAAVADAVAQEQQASETLRAELVAANDELERLRAAAGEAPTSDQLEAERAQAHEAKLAAEQAQAELATTAAALARERRTVETLRSELRTAEEEAERARRAASEAVAKLPTHNELEEERRRADRASAALAAARARSEMADAEAKSTLIQARSELRRATNDAAAAAEAANEEKQRVTALRGEVSQLRDELARANDALAERVAELEQVQAHTAKSADRASAEQKAVEKLRGELAAARTELGRERAQAEQAEQAAQDARREASDLAERVAELEQAQAHAAKSAGRGSAEEKAVHKLRGELAAAQAELKEAKRAMAERPTVEEFEHAQGEVAALTEQIAQLERAQGAVVDAAALRAAQQEVDRERSRAERAEAAAATAAEAERAAVEALRSELGETRAELEQLQAAAAAQPEPEPADDGGAAVTPVDPGAPAWGPEAQRALSAALGTSDDWRGALKHAVKIVGSEGSWDAAVAWLPDGRQGMMRCAAAWMGETLSASTFETQVWQHRQKPPAGITGNGHAPHSVLELDTAKDALLRAAAAEGMGSAVVVPIGDESQLIGMVQLFSSFATPPCDELMVSVEGIALQLAGIARLLSSASTPQWRFGRL